MQFSYMPKKKTNRIFVNRAKNFHTICRESNRSVFSSVVVVLIKNMDKIKIPKKTWVHSFQRQFKYVHF